MLMMQSSESVKQSTSRTNQRRISSDVILKENWGTDLQNRVIPIDVSIQLRAFPSTRYLMPFKIQS